MLEKFFADPVPDLQRVSDVQEVSPRASVEAMQALGPSLPKVDPKTLYEGLRV